MATTTVEPTKSILDTTKKLIGLSKEYDVFDQDIMVHVNACFATLSSLGLTANGKAFRIEDDSKEWSDFSTDEEIIGLTKQYVYYKTKLAFDPPSTSFGQEALKQACGEMEFRLRVKMEEIQDD